MKKSHIFWSWLSGGGVSYDSDYQAWLTAGQTAGYTLPPTAVKLAQSNFITALKAFPTMFSKLVTLRLMHSGSVQMCTLSVVNTATEIGVLSATPPTFSEGNGVKSNGTSSYIRDSILANEWAGIEADITCGQYISESSTAFSATKDSHGFLTDSGSNVFRLTPMFNSTLGVKGGFNNATIGFPSSNHKGLYIHSVNSTQAVSYKDGTKDTDANTEVAPTVTNPRLILARNGNGGSGVSPVNFYDFYVAIDFVAHLFTDQDAADFRTAFLEYQTEVGLP